MSRHPEQVSGQCYCGAVRFRAALPTRFCSHCHCHNCRRAHGAGYVTWAGFLKEQVTIVSGEDRLTRFETPTRAIRSFCTVCGSTLFFESPRWESELHVALANLDGPIDRAPSAHVYFDRHPSWISVSDNLPRLGGESGTEPL